MSSDTLKYLSALSKMYFRQEDQSTESDESITYAQSTSFSRRGKGPSQNN